MQKLFSIIYKKASILSKYILPKKVYMQLNFVLTEKYIEKKISIY